MKKLAFFVALLVVSPLHAGVDLEWEVSGDTFRVGDIVQIGLYAVADNNGGDEPFASMSVIVLWDADVLALQGVLDNGPYTWAFSGFPSDYDGLNDSLDDGDAYYQAWPNFGDTPVATAEGLLVTTLEFEAVAPAEASDVQIEALYGYFAETYVGDEQYPGWNIVDDMGSTVVHVGPGGQQLGDMNCDGEVDFDDINAFVLALGGEDDYLQAYPDCQWLLGDINGDDTVDFNDINPFVALLGG